MQRFLSWCSIFDASGIWTIVFAVGAAQGVFLCGALFLRRVGNRPRFVDSFAVENDLQFEAEHRAP